ncbi:MAG: hypothetical protein K2N84_02390 [Clostridia bacterium]|nr:hypothetical protein [Clostridia bacterium]
MATFTEAEVRLLVNTRINRQELTVDGISGLGFPFTTTCKLTVDDAGNPAIFADRIIADFIYTYKHKHRQADMFASLRISIAKDCPPDAALYVNTISAGGTRIYTNTDFPSLKATIMKMKEERAKELGPKGMLIEPQDKKDSVTQKINDYVGQPVIIFARDNTGELAMSGVLVGSEHYTTDGCPCFIIIDGLLSKHSCLGTIDSALYLVKKDGTMNIKAATGNVKKIRESIIGKIADCSGPRRYF